uniref:Uncharacterized protein n=1 Tax=Anguilla anguilla TaxID=7936 RepID=A0A0E9VLK0_ANGAN
MPFKFIFAINRRSVCGLKCQKYFSIQESVLSVPRLAFGPTRKFI